MGVTHSVRRSWFASWPNSWHPIHLKENWNLIDRFDWHLFPLEILRMLPMIMVVSQRRLDVKVFGNQSFMQPVFIKKSRK